MEEEGNLPELQDRVNAKMWGREDSQARLAYYRERLLCKTVTTATNIF